MEISDNTKYPIGKIVRKLRKDKKWSLEELASKIEGYDAASLSRFERSEQGIKEKKLEQIADALDTSIFGLYALAMENSTGKKTVKLPAVNKLIGIMEELPEYTIKRNEQIKTKNIPVISNVQAGKWREAVDPYEMGDALSWRNTSAKVSDSAFALIVDGDSMLNPSGDLSIPNGSIVIVDPEIQAENGSIIVAKLEETQEVTLKKLAIDGPNRYLIPLNPDYDKIVINGNCTIVGVVKKVEIDL